MNAPRRTHADIIQARAREAIDDARLVVEHARRGELTAALRPELLRLVELGRQASLLVAADATRS
jgi:hypothetical protein